MSESKGIALTLGGTGDRNVAHQSIQSPADMNSQTEQLDDDGMDVNDARGGNAHIGETHGSLSFLNSQTGGEHDTKEDDVKLNSVADKPAVSAIPGQSNGSHATLLVKQIINSGTFGTGAIAKAPSTKPTASSTLVKVTSKYPVASLLKKSTSSTVVPSKTPTSSMRAATASTTSQTRRQSLAPITLKPASTGERPVPTSSKATAKPTTVTTRPSAISPTSSAKSASSRPKAFVSEGVKRSTQTLSSRQSMPANMKPLLSAPTKAHSPRSSFTVTSSSKPPHMTQSKSSIREIKEDNEVVVDSQIQLKETSDTLPSTIEHVTQLENRIAELTISLDASLADCASKASLVQQVDQEKIALKRQLSEARSILANLETRRHEDESALVALRQDLKTAKAASHAQNELEQGLRVQIQNLEAQIGYSQENLETTENSSTFDLENVEIEHKTLLKAQDDLAALSTENDTLKAAHVATMQELEAKIKNLVSMTTSAGIMSGQIIELQREKEENMGRISELEIEILEMKESQEAGEDERGRLLRRIQTLEIDLVEASISIKEGHDAEKAKEAEIAAQIDDLQKIHAVALKFAIQEQNELYASLEGVKAELSAALIENEQTKILHHRNLEEAQQAHVAKQADLSEQIKCIATELESQEAIYHSKVEIVTAEHGQLLKEAFERAKIEAGTAHAQELQTLRISSATSIKQVQAANQLSLEDLKAEHANLLHSEVSRLEKSIGNLNLDLKATQDDLTKTKAALETARTAVKSLTQQRDEAYALSASALDSATQAQEIIRLSNELSNANDDLSATSEMLNLTRVSLAELSVIQKKDLLDVTTARAEEVTRLHTAHEEDIKILEAQNYELSAKVSDLEGEVLMLKATAPDKVSQKSNGNVTAPPISLGVTKEELQRLHEAHNLKIYDIQADHEKVVKVLKNELETSLNKVAGLDAEVQRRAMEIQYLEQDQEESQEQIARLKADLETLSKDQPGGA